MPRNYPPCSPQYTLFDLLQRESGCVVFRYIALSIRYCFFQCKLLPLLPLLWIGSVKWQWCHMLNLVAYLWTVYLTRETSPLWVLCHFCFSELNMYGACMLWGLLWLTLICASEPVHSKNSMRTQLPYLLYGFSWKPCQNLCGCSSVLSVLIIKPITTLSLHMTTFLSDLGLPMQTYSYMPCCVWGFIGCDNIFVAQDSLHVLPWMLLASAVPRLGASREKAV